jgi:hypothetical protein
MIRLSATHALRVLDDLRSDDAWTEQGTVIGELVTVSGILVNLSTWQYRGTGIFRRLDG